MLYSVYIGFMFYTDGRKTYDTPSGMNSVKLKLPHNNAEDKFDRSEWYTLDQCFAAWGCSGFNPVLGTLKTFCLMQVMLMGMFPCRSVGSESAGRLQQC